METVKEVKKRDQSINPLVQLMLSCKQIKTRKANSVIKSQRLMEGEHNEV